MPAAARLVEEGPRSGPAPPPARPVGPAVTIFQDGPALFDDRVDAGRRPAREMGDPLEGRVAVYGLARGGVPVAAEVARALGAPLDALVVRKVGHPLHEEYALGAVTADGPPFMRELRGLDGRAVPELRARVQAAAAQARAMDERLHQDVGRLDPSGTTCVLVDDGLATGATMVAACRWARARGASRVVAAVPVTGQDPLHEQGPSVNGQSSVSVSHEDPLGAGKA